MYECLYTNELIKWRSGQLIVLYTGFLICFLCLWDVCVFAHLCIGVCVCAWNEAMCMNSLLYVCIRMYICACMGKFVRYNMSCPGVSTSGDSSVVSCCFIYHQRESAGLIL